MRSSFGPAGAVALFASALSAQTATQLVNSDAAGAFLVNAPPRSIGNFSVSSRARYTAFQTLQAFTASDTNGVADVYVKDATTGAVVRVSVSSSGAQGTAGSFRPHLSANGRFVVFESDAVELVSGDFNGERDVFLHDRDADEDGVFDETAAGGRKTVRVSVDAAGAEAFGGGSVRASVSDDGRHVCFASSATNLVAGDTNGGGDVFVRFRNQNGGSHADADAAGNATTVRVSVTSAGVQGTLATGGFVDAPSISADGRHVAFGSTYSNLVTGDTNGALDVFVHDRDADQDGVFDETASGGRRTTRVSVSTAGAQAANGGAGFTQQGISGNGRYVLFASYDALTAGDAGLDPDLHVFDRDGDSDGVLDEGPAGLDRPLFVGPADQLATDAGAAISPSGRFVAYRSADANLVPGDANGIADVFVLDRNTGATTRVSVDAASVEQHGPSGASAGVDVADDASSVFATDATDLFTGAGGDQNAAADLYRNGLFPRTTASDTTPSFGSATNLTLSAPFDPGAYYVLAASTGVSPGLPVPGGAIVPMNADAVFLLSLTAPSLFLVGFAGFLDANGLAAAALVVPPFPALVGFAMYVGFVAFDLAASPPTLVGVSNALRLVVAP